MRFERVSFENFRKDMIRCGFSEDSVVPSYEQVRIPVRKTRYSAGYDFVTPVPFNLEPGERIVIPTGIKVYFEPEEAARWHLQLFIRSSIGIRRSVVMSNQTGVIDADYHNNPDNEGDMLIALHNMADYRVKFDVGERLIQGIFLPHGITSDDDADGERTGGVGSTDYA